MKVSFRIYSYSSGLPGAVVSSASSIGVVNRALLRPKSASALCYEYRDETDISDKVARKNSDLDISMINGEEYKDGDEKSENRPESPSSSSTTDPLAFPAIDAQLQVMEEKLGIRNPTDWYRINSRILGKHQFTRFVMQHGGLFKLLKKYRPYEYLPWMFGHLPKGVSRDSESITAALEYIEKSLKITKPEDWYNVSHMQFRKLGVLAFFSNNGGIFSLLERFRPSTKWDPWRFNKIPKEIRSNPENLDSALRYVETSLNLKRPEDWYQVTVDQLRKLGVYRYFGDNGGYIALLKIHRPSISWIPWKFNRLPKGSSKNPEIIKSALEFIEKSLHIVDPEDWYKVSQEQLKELGVYEFVHANEGLYEMLVKFHPVVDWVPFKFNKIPVGYYRDPKSIEKFLKYVENEFRIFDPEDWYKVTYEQMMKLGVYWYIRKLGGLYELLQKYRPQVHWEPWKFHQLPKGLSKSPESIEAALSYIETSLGLEAPQAWYRVSISQIQKLGVLHFVTQNGGLYQLLRLYRPTFAWQESKFRTRKPIASPMKSDD